MSVPTSDQLSNLLSAISASTLSSGSGEAFLDVADMQARYGVGRSTVWAWAARTDFPKPIRLSEKCTRWRLSDLVAWEARRAAEK